uniref:Uncharacterized protein n=1 Tax=Meloidogyne enterolobii TaxID=390850 RepID=A0A6V7WC65_MELEN|nr:unnamed protein product [Meloidogyne enterolobii]
MKRTYLLRRPKDDDEEDFYSQEAVKAKPIDPHLARNLGPTFAAGKDFVRASQKSQNEFYGSQKIVEASTSGGGGIEKEYRQMTHDERNNLSASIIKAELKGDKEKVEKLKRRLEEGIIEIKSKNGETGQEKNGEKKSVILMEMDRKSGLTKPAVASNKSNKMSDNSDNKQHIMGVIEEEYSKESSLGDMLAEEKRTTAEDQLSMFNRAAEIFSQNRQDEEGFFDDALDSRKKRKFDKADSQQRQTMIKGWEIFFCLFLEIQKKNFYWGFMSGTMQNELKRSIYKAEKKLVRVFKIFLGSGFGSRKVRVSDFG